MLGPKSHAPARELLCQHCASAELDSGKVSLILPLLQHQHLTGYGGWVEKETKEVGEDGWTQPVKKVSSVAPALFPSMMWLLCGASVQPTRNYFH